MADFASIFALNDLGWWMVNGNASDGADDGDGDNDDMSEEQCANAWLGWWVHGWRWACGGSWVCDVGKGDGNASVVAIVDTGDGIGSGNNYKNSYNENGVL